MEVRVGETSIEVNAACVTLKSVDPCIPPMEAVTLTFPWLSVEANPWLSLALEMERISGLEESQVTWSVISEFELSVKIPVALKFSCKPFATVEFVGETEIETKAAGVTISFTEPIIFSLEAEIVTIPVSAVSNIPLF